MTVPRFDDPVTRIVWMEAKGLNANAYNPNVVFEPELKLLERSILLTGWVQPILVSRTGTIIDGFHRWRLSLESQGLRERYDGLVPCAVLDVDEKQARILTVRMNRAKGTHVTVRMADLIRKLVDEQGMTPQEIATELGATMLEVQALYAGSLFKMRDLKNYRYSEAWAPKLARKRHRLVKP